jgi:tetratricopeptide (TPR) repeat protein
MDCALAKERSVAERYLLGQLSEDERVAFEEHFFECDKCFGELETLREIRAQLAEKGGGSEASHLPRTTGKLWVLAAGIAATLIAVGVGLRLFLPTHEIPSELVEFVRFDPPEYTPVRLRGATDEAHQRFRSAMELYSAGDFISAIPGLEEAFELDPNAPNISFYLGACYLLTGRNSDGIETLQHTIDLGDTPYLEEALILSAKARLVHGDVSGAKRAFEEAAELGGDFESEARDALAKLREGSGAR